MTSLLSGAIAVSNAEKAVAPSVAKLVANPNAYSIQQMEATVQPLVSVLTTTNSQVQSLIPNLPQIPAQAAQLFGQGLTADVTAFQGAGEIINSTSSAADSGGALGASIANEQHTQLAGSYNTYLAGVESTLADLVGILSHDPDIPPSELAQIYSP